MGRHVPCTGKKRNVYRFLVEKPEVKRLRGRRRHGLQDNIKIDLLNWLHLDEDIDNCRTVLYSKCGTV